ncbi:hypothetical protein MIND_00915400 [Mycena indigotica]|uniref:Pali-domain-containing protein n=1 Tax=Mycena indigotica TaxID=2126181 RepID=A0A8H6SC56_9AGAR|nr:uncharacterized protein MIND_00915400 [Mycena indigotica]KAF7296841.1 hypothetical protein MIND_00915400 [Mycena indigotica]
MSRKHFLIGASCLGVALFLSLIGSISLPHLTALDYVRAKFATPILSGQDTLSEIRLGIWGPCFYDEHDHRLCFNVGHGYPVPLLTTTGQIEIISGSWTRGLAVHPVATGVIAIAFGFAFAKFESAPLISVLTSVLSALILLIAFAIDIALYAEMHHKVGELHGVKGNVDFGTAFWFTLVELILVLVAAVMVFMGRRAGDSSESYPMFSSPSGGFFSRFKK